MVLCRKHRPVRLQFGSSNGASATCGQQANMAANSGVAGGFLSFSASYPQHCDTKSDEPDCSGQERPVSDACCSQGPTQVLSFLYVGSQADALDADVIRRHGITHVLNVSSSCPQSAHVPDANFLRIAVNDGYVDKLLPHFQRAFQFLDRVRASNGRCLVHCLAGISRSPTLAIAYVMKHRRLSHEEAYRFVKEKRTNISPNFNFLGQLLEFEKQLKRSDDSTSAAGSEAKRQRTGPAPKVNTNSSSSSSSSVVAVAAAAAAAAVAAQSPTTALSRLSFTPCSAGSLAEFNGTRLEQLAVMPCLAAAAAAAAAATGRRRLAGGHVQHRPRSAAFVSEVAEVAAAAAAAAAPPAAGLWSGRKSRSEHLVAHQLLQQQELQQQQQQEQQQQQQQQEQQQQEQQQQQQQQRQQDERLSRSMESLDSIKSGSNSSQELLACP